MDTNPAHSTGSAGVPALPDSGTEIGTNTATCVSRLFKALGEPVRVQLLSLVARSFEGEVCFRHLADEFDMPQPSLSHHLKILVNAGLLSRERKGTWSCYRVVEASLTVLETILRPGGPFRASSRCEDEPNGQPYSLVSSPA